MAGGDGVPGRTMPKHTLDDDMRDALDESNAALNQCLRVALYSEEAWLVHKSQGRMGEANVELRQARITLRNRIRGLRRRTRAFAKKI